MEPTEEDVEALEDELSRVWHDASSDRRYSFNAVARHVLSRPAPPGTIRLGSGLTETQMGWSADDKKWVAGRYDAVATALAEPALLRSLRATAEGSAAWDAIHARFLQMAADLRAAAEPPVDPRIAVVQAELNKPYQGPLSPSKEMARAILAALDAAGGKELPIRGPTIIEWRGLIDWCRKEAALEAVTRPAMSKMHSDRAREIEEMLKDAARV